MGKCDICGKDISGIVSSAYDPNNQTWYCTECYNKKESENKNG